MTTLNDGELARFSHQPPPADPFDPAAPLPPRRHIRIRVEETPAPELVETVALVEDEDNTVRVIMDPAAATQDALNAAGNSALLLTDHADGPVGRRMAALTAVPELYAVPHHDTDAGTGHGDYEWRSGQ
ncbi:MULTISPECIES: hypothetical protein [unclassified Streptomyces]|uniref:hypothetical protein n=1 Tax=unclassified Streptomyces TaxID=2593676 RepID=UPI00114CBB71|nr:MULTISPECIES: hypothetical protein [unclassified Streptomyces]MYS19175.1 hypothetical protein [Streptomyces sp. SID4948]